MITKSEYKWKVCPIQGPQLNDVRKEDLVCGGHFRLCKTYRGGGGYDKFPAIAKRRLNLSFEPSVQFIVQLYGCHLRCPYCYVTEEGYLGNYVEYSSESLVEVFEGQNVPVFHLMGGAPALYLDKWRFVLDILPEKYIFHSDLLLTEGLYTLSGLKSIVRSNALYAVNIKGTSRENYITNTGRKFLHNTFWHNLEALVNCGANFYLTFTNPDHCLEDFKFYLTRRFGEAFLKDHFIINLIQYNALDAIDVRVKEL